MPNSTDINWTPIVAFYFSVSFQGGVQCTVSFSEVSGLELTREIDENRCPKNITHPNLVLKRAMQPLPEELSTWITKCTRFNEWINTCNVIVSLMDEDDKIVASWECSNAYPKKWGLTPLLADKSGLVMETLELTYDILERKK